MKAFTIPTVFYAVDKMSNPLKGMGGHMAALNAVSARLQRTFHTVQNSANSMFNKLTGGQATLMIASGLGLAAIAARKFVDEASKIEDATARFTPILGSVKKATQFVGMLNQEAATTPFQFEDIATVAGRFLPVVNGNMQEAIKLFRMIGDTTGGSVERMQSASLGLNKALLKGKVDMESLNMIAEAGIPIFPALGKTMGIAENKMGDLFKAISAGKVPTSALITTFETLTSKGGMFFKGMEIASQTFTGKMSSMLDNINLAFGAFGDAALPILKEYVDQIGAAAGKAMEWANENKELIKTKVDEFFQNVKSAVSFLNENLSTIITTVKVYVGTLLALKAISMACSIITGTLTVATTAYNVAMGIAGAITGKANIAIGKNAVAMGAYKAAMAIGTAAQWLFNAATIAGGVAMQILMSPITLIILGIAALAAGIYFLIKKWDEWGAAVSLLLGPLGLVISLIQSFRRNWDMITEAFRTGGILEGLKAIGKTILDAVLMPIQQVLELIGKFTGADWAISGANKLQDLRDVMGGTVEPVNLEAAKQEAIQRSFKETVNNSRATFQVQDPLGLLRMTDKQGDINVNMMPKVSSTMGSQF